MSLISFQHDQDSVLLRVKILDSSATTGAGLTGLTSASSGLIISTIADNESTATAYTAAGSTIEGITTLGTYAAPTATKVRFKEVDSTNHKGIYEIQIADARFAVASAKSLLISILGATDCAETDVLIPLTEVDPWSTALPGAYGAGTAGYILGTDVAGDAAAILIDTNELQTDWGNGGRLDLILDSVSAAGDPWATSIPGAYGAGTAGYIIGNNLDAAVSAVAAYIDTEVAAILTDTGTTIPASLSAMDAKIDTIDGIVDSILADTNELQTDDVPTLIAAVSTKVDTAQADLDIITGADGVNLLTATQASIDAIESDTNELQTDDVPGLLAAQNDITAASVYTTQMTQSYAADGVEPTLAQAIYLIMQRMTEFAISGTVITINELDGTTAAATLTLDDATTPTSSTRAS